MIGGIAGLSEALSRALCEFLLGTVPAVSLSRRDTAYLWDVLESDAPDTVHPASTPPGDTEPPEPPTPGVGGPDNAERPVQGGPAQTRGSEGPKKRWGAPRPRSGRASHGRTTT